ncbi:MarR family winged helix-turn-helix transcriptional regulator [Actinomadura harenae]|nr:MarR family transcriptional regulator [Actinomadura harenae]
MSVNPKGGRLPAADSESAADGGVADPAGRIIEAMTDLAGALGRFNDLIAQRLGIATTDLLCLHVLNRAGASTAGALSTQLARTTGAVTHMLDRLEKAGYVQRMQDPQDRRRVLVEASPEGLERIAALYERLDARSRQVMAAFSGEELATVQTFLQRNYEATVEECDRMVS